ncbi:hypothetical protein DESUT3_01850 [Desulfuromonas versatilis]|uniref:Response regulatory domain-containing protein n=1 Tax=Desulfuromonas versatilis TaxID=2802975 RepID=A0ABM8HRC9_9BACT|nr:response regulator [Desulfuromonas versatilis]BCR03116.1 hypothetical protein DESUT3_01850 [Desulfuromonas versatilis]
MNQNRILVVDDEAHVRKAVQRALLDEDYEILTAPSASEALKLLADEHFKVVVSDERMPGMQGSELLSTISLRWPETVRILLTGQASLEAAVRAVNEGEIYRFLMKPWNDAELRMAIRSGIEKHDLEVKNRKLLSLVRSQELKLRALKGEALPLPKAEGRCSDGSFHLKELTEQEISELLNECGIGDVK